MRGSRGRGSRRRVPDGSRVLVAGVALGIAMGLGGCTGGVAGPDAEPSAAAAASPDPGPDASVLCPVTEDEASAVLDRPFGPFVATVVDGADVGAEADFVHVSCSSHVEPPEGGDAGDRAAEAEAPRDDEDGRDEDGHDGHGEVAELLYAYYVEPQAVQSGACHGVESSSWEPAAGDVAGLGDLRSTVQDITGQTVEYTHVQGVLGCLDEAPDRSVGVSLVVADEDGLLPESDLTELLEQVVDRLPADPDGLRRLHADGT